LTIVLCSFNNITNAQWSTDPTVNNAVSVAANNQSYPQLVSDGAGGAIITWDDYRSGSTHDIYAQRIDASGAVVWTADGVAICVAIHDQSSPVLVSDGTGGAIIAWSDTRNGNSDIFAQHIDGAGSVQWITDGVALCTASSVQSYPTIITDGAAGAIITWQDYRSGTNYDIYAQRIDATGAVKWTTDGVAISVAIHDQTSPTIVSDGAGGAIISWYDYRSNTTDDIYAQRIDGTGSMKWTADGVAISKAAGNQTFPTIVSDGAAGAIITWQDSRNGNNDIYAQRVRADSVVQWTADGVAICTETHYQYTPTIVSDGAGGAIITWYDLRSATNYDIYAQRIDASGAVNWTADGVAISIATNDQTIPIIVSDGSGGAIITWDDYRNGSNYDIYAQRVNASGAVQWLANGVAISATTGGQYAPALLGDGSGEAIIAWHDYRGGTYTDIYASKIGSAGVLPVELTSLQTSARKDEVELQWSTATELNNYGFEIQRSQLRQQFTKVGFVAGAGSSSSPHEYSFLDRNIPAGHYSYRIRQIDKDGGSKYTKEVDVVVSVAPLAFALGQNYPNPFNPTTRISFQLAAVGKVSLKIYDLLGREVETLVDGEMNAGFHLIVFDASRLSSGIYFYRLSAGEYAATKKLVLLK
jgi:hypothetical protein